MKIVTIISVLVPLFVLMSLVVLFLRSLLRVIFVKNIFTKINKVEDYIIFISKNAETIKSSSAFPLNLIHDVKCCQIIIYAYDELIKFLSDMKAKKMRKFLMIKSEREKYDLLFKQYEKEKEKYKNVKELVKKYAEKYEFLIEC